MLDGQLVAIAGEGQGIVNQLIWSVNREAHQRSTGLVVLHAASAASGDRAVIVLGKSGSGKSTFVSALVEGGLTYVTDEAVGIDLRSGAIVPYQRAITLKRGSWSLFAAYEPPSGAVVPRFGTDQWHVDPAAIGSVATVGDRFRPALVIGLAYVPRRGLTVERVSRASALVELVGSSMDEHRLTPASFATLCDVARETPFYRVQYSALSRAVDFVGTALHS